MILTCHHDARGWGETWTVGGETEWRNIDRPGHDQRYAIDCGKIKREIGWSHAHGFEDGLRNTVRWYLEHRDWVQSVRTGEYHKWIKANYTAPERTKAAWFAQVSACENANKGGDQRSPDDSATQCTFSASLFRIC